MSNSDFVVEDFPVRDKDIRKEIEPLINDLVECYYASSPKALKGDGPDKTEMAQDALEVWWLLFDKILGWAQNHILGEEVLLAETAAVKHFEKHFIALEGDNIHMSEAIGALFASDDSSRDWDLLERITKWSESENRETSPDLHLPSISVRRAGKRLLQGKSINSLHWRGPIVASLGALELGYVDELLRPAKLKPRGNPMVVESLKKEAVCYVSFLAGGGKPKGESVTYVSEEICFNNETLRTWEKRFRKNPKIANEIQCAYHAGEIGDLFKRCYPEQLDDGTKYGRFDGVPNIHRIDALYWQLSRLSLRDLGNDIRSAGDRNSS